ncbi:MAG: DUF1214 domain-containing protein [Proteobacteria bacterium]|nr:DUF1214 domain-containing protein [Pseudomonadota bacterium]
MTATTDKRMQAREAWARYCDELRKAGDQFLRTDFPIDDLDLSEGLRYLARLTSTSIDRNVEGANPAKPFLYMMCNEHVKVGGDNPDNRYYAAPVSAAHRYVLRGDFRRCNYFSVVTTGRVDGSEAITSGSISGDSCKRLPDGTTEICVGREPFGTNHVAMDDRTSTLILRCTIEEPGDKDVRPLLTRIDGTDPEVLTLEGVSSALQNSARFVSNVSRFFAGWMADFQKWKNQLPLYPDQAYLIAIGGDPNIKYYWGSWELRPGEALILSTRKVPKATTWNCQLCNAWLESLDYTFAQIHLNSRTAAYDDDGGVTMIVADSDPGHPNWLQTLGHAHGALCMRLVGASEPMAVDARVVSLGEARQLAKHLKDHS